VCGCSLDIAGSNLKVIWPDSFMEAAAPGGQAEGRGAGQRKWGVWMQS
jgi:hypothetical protein